MNWEAWEPFILPWVHGCPGSTVAHHVRQAAIRFCAETNAYREQMDAVLADGVSSRLALPIDDQVEVSKLYSVTVDGCDRPVYPMQSAISMLQRDRCVELSYTPDRRELIVSPVPADGQKIVVVAALKPAQTAFGVEDAIFDQYAQDIANGALATLLLIPRQEWTNQASGAVYQGLFDRCVDGLKSAAARGFSSTWNRRSYVRMF